MKPRLPTLSPMAATLVVNLLVIAVLAPSVVAHDDGTTSHLWLNHVKSMRDAGTINASNNPVHWTKLQGVPAGLADGIDHGSEIAGFGLVRQQSIYGPYFAVRPDKVQLRVAATCSAGDAIRAIREDGTIDCDPVSYAKRVVDDDTATVTCTDSDIGDVHGRDLLIIATRAG